MTAAGPNKRGKAKKPNTSGREDRERRRETRLASTNLVSYCSLRGAKVYSVLGVAETLDISLTGLRILVREPLVLGQILEFGLKLGDQIHYLRGQLVRGAMRDEECFEFGVSFQNVTPYVREAIKHYLSWTGHFKGQPSRGGMTGQFEGNQLVDLVQMLGVAGKTGVLRIMTDYSDAFFGMLVFNEGKVVAASTSHGSRSHEAAFELATARHGSFEFRPDLPSGVAFEMTLGVETLLLEALRRTDETGRSEKKAEEPGPAPAPGSSLGDLLHDDDPYGSGL